MTVSMSLPGVADEFGFLLRATLLMGAAGVFAVALRKVGAPAAARHMVWLLCIAALLALPILWSLVPVLRLPILPVEAAATAVAVAPKSSVAPSAATFTGSVSSNSPEYLSWRVMLLVAYALGAVTLLLRLFVGRQMLARLWRDASAVRDADWHNLLSQLSAEMRLSRRVELRISRGPAMPMTWGTLAPKVLLPAEASVWPPERCRLVLLHELAHVARRDSLSRSVASLACALYWFHPGAWFAARQMRMEQEHAADDRVLTVGGSAEAYARSLLHVARAMGGRLQHEMAATMAGTGQLERRLVSITSSTRRDRPSPTVVFCSAMLATLATLIVAAGAPVSASSTLRSPIRLERATIASPIEEGVESARADDSSEREKRAERISPTQARSEDALERSAQGSTVASMSHPAGRASEEMVKRGQARLQTVPRKAELESRGEEGNRNRRQAPAYAQQLPDYGWKLPQREVKGHIGAVLDPSRPNRFSSPTSLDAASRERTGRAKWAPLIPQIVPPGTPTRSTLPNSQGTLMLSWSLEVGAKQ